MMYRKKNFNCNESMQSKSIDCSHHTSSDAQCTSSACAYCGNQFLRSSKKVYFCSTECAVSARKSGWMSPEMRHHEAERLLNQVQVKLRCNQCGKYFFKSYDDNTAVCRDALHDQYCSEECMNLHKHIQHANVATLVRLSKRFKSHSKKLDCISMF